MTRVNVVPVGELSDHFLLTEHNELPKVYTLVRDWQRRGFGPSTIDIPSAFTISSAGRARFFYDKLLWVRRREESLISEGIRRGVLDDDTDYRHGRLDGFELHWLNDWEPDGLALYLNRLELRDRQKARKT